MLTFFYGAALNAGHTARRPGVQLISPGYPAWAMSPWMAP